MKQVGRSSHAQRHENKFSDKIKSPVISKTCKDNLNIRHKKEKKKNNSKFNQTDTKPLAISETDNLKKWSDLFNDDVGYGFSPSENFPLRKKTSKAEIPDLSLKPTCPNTKTNFVGNPIDFITAKSLRKVLHGNATCLFTNDWKKCSFKFRGIKTPIPYGLEANMPGPRPVVLSLQAYVLKHLLFYEENYCNDEAKKSAKLPPTPSNAEQEHSLIEGICDMIWKASEPVVNKQNNSGVEYRHCIVVIPGEEECFKSDGYFVPDGLTEKLWLYSIESRPDLLKFIRRNIYFFTERSYPACILLTYSIILSRGISGILKDMGGYQNTLLKENSRSTQAFVNLLLMGRATCFVHNNTVYSDATDSNFAIPKIGLHERSEIGFLYFNKAEPEKKRLQVGSMFKTPHLPIWLTLVNGSFGILFCKTLNLIGDWKTELYFTLHYYTGHFSQKDKTIITLDSRTRVVPNFENEITIWDNEEEKEKKQPSLELCISTKWNECIIDWNGELPYY